MKANKQKGFFRQGRKKIFSRERILLATGLVLFALVVGVFVYAINFLNGTIVPALSPSVPDSGEMIYFDFEAYEELGLEEPETAAEEAPTTEATEETATTTG